MERLSITVYKGNRIVFFDAKNLKEDEICSGILKISETVISNKINLVMIDVRYTLTTPRIKETAYNEIKRSNNELGIVYIALIGLTDIQKMIASTVNPDQYFAVSTLDAKEWLVSKVKHLV